MVLVGHEGSASFNLRLKDGVPQFLGRDSFTSTTFLLVFFIQRLKLSTVNFMQVGRFIRAEKRPITIGLNAFHAEGGYEIKVQ